MGGGWAADAGMMKDCQAFVMDIVSGVVAAACICCAPLARRRWETRALEKED